MHWNYEFGVDLWEEECLSMREATSRWFNAYLWTIAQTNVQSAWLRNVRKRLMKPEIQKILEGIEKAWEADCTPLDEVHTDGADTLNDMGYSPGADGLLCKEWTAKVAIVKEIINNW